MKKRRFWNGSLNDAGQYMSIASETVKYCASIFSFEIRKICHYADNQFYSVDKSAHNTAPLTQLPRIPCTGERKLEPKCRKFVPLSAELLFIMQLIDIFYEQKTEFLLLNEINSMSSVSFNFKANIWRISTQFYSTENKKLKCEARIRLWFNPIVWKGHLNHLKYVSSRRNQSHSERPTFEQIQKKNCCKNSLSKLRISQ